MHTFVFVVLVAGGRGRRAAGHHVRAGGDQGESLAQHLMRGLYYHLNNPLFKSCLKVADFPIPISRVVFCFK